MLTVDIDLSDNTYTLTVADMDHDEIYFPIDAVCGRYVIDAKSIMGLLSLGIPKEIFIVIHTNNKDVISKFEEDISKWKVEE